MNRVYERKRGNTRWHPVGQEGLWYLLQMVDRDDTTASLLLALSHLLSGTPMFVGEYEYQLRSGP